MKRICFLVVALCSTGLMGCTDFLLQDTDGGSVVGRSMEFAQQLHSRVVSIPAKASFQSQVGEKQGMRWVQKYALIGCNALGDERLIVDGMNEKGLSVGDLWLPGSAYPKYAKKRLESTIALTDLGLWMLGMFSTVEEVKAGLQQIEIYPNYVDAMHEVPPIHFSVHDATGSSIVIEFVDQTMRIHENVVGVLTNAPHFQWHLINLDNYINLSAINKAAVKFDGTVLRPTGQGSGLLGLPGDWTPPSRFVKIAAQKAFVTKAKSSAENINLAFHLLNTVDIPYGAIQGADGKGFDYTQWVVVKDLKNKKLYFRTYNDLIIREFDGF